MVEANSTNSPAPAYLEFGANVIGGHTPYSLRWNFDDGIRDNSTDAGEKVLHKFDKSGDYNITLLAEDSSSPSENTSATIHVTITQAENRTASKVSNSAQPLKIIIDSNSNDGPVPATIELTANMTGGLPPYALVWNFVEPYT